MQYEAWQEEEGPEGKSFLFADRGILNDDAVCFFFTSHNLVRLMCFGCLFNFISQSDNLLFNFSNARLYNLLKIIFLIVFSEMMMMG